MPKAFLYSILAMLLFQTACRDKTTGKEDDQPAEVKTPVSVTTVQQQTLTDYLDLNATATFLQNNYVKSNANGYVKSVNAQPGQYVESGKTIFTIQTKESIAIGNSISSLDTGFKFSGVNQIKASGHGYITQLNHQAGDYVQDGEQLAVISDMNSFVFILNLPYELRPYVLNKRNVELVLPDSVHLNGYISSVMPTVDSASQTQNVIIKVQSKNPIPENVIAKVRIIKFIKPNAPTLPKSAILSNESLTDFWVMKMIDSITAVKVDIRKGMELNGRVEILDPHFSSTDLILVNGNYGLPDTAKVTILKD